ncbi:hypothetical protein Pmani_028533 [Petrolisthes manimaculis]|uniref:Uncharacterized protein n=1 Tax=Petrolisthes manimaculis TaxID=1843537 RepID=A0AAE1P1Z3_9EUCA|nr:hypothetical protein Pmani_028533 [Petrolisthes manimaculis]
MNGGRVRGSENPINCEIRQMNQPSLGFSQLTFQYGVLGTGSGTTAATRTKRKTYTELPPFLIQGAADFPQLALDVLLHRCLY